MVKKNIKKHSFLKEEPVLHLNSGVYVMDGDDIITFGSIANTHVYPSLALNDIGGNSIFVVNENEIVWRGQTLVTEERVKEIVEEQIRELGLI